MEIAYAVSAAVLGCFFGAQLCEAMLLVPYWKSMDPSDFKKYYNKQGGKIHSFFSPLTILAFLIPCLTAFIGLSSGQDKVIIHLGLGLSCLLFFSTYFLFFKKANEEFTMVEMDQHQLQSALSICAKWHWSRVVLEGLAFGLALFLLY